MAIAGTDDHQSLAIARLVGTTLLVMLLAVMPMPNWAVWLRPEFSALLVVYAVLSAPFRVGMVFAWSFGLCIDVLESAVLGQNALSLTVLAYLCFLLHTRIRLFSILEQSASVFVLVGIHQLIGNWVQSLNGFEFYDLAFLVPALMSALCWPLTLSFLERVDLFPATA